MFSFRPPQSLFKDFANVSTRLSITSILPNPWVEGPRQAAHKYGSVVPFYGAPWPELRMSCEIELQNVIKYPFFFRVNLVLKDSLCVKQLTFFKSVVKHRQRRNVAMTKSIFWLVNMMRKKSITGVRPFFFFLILIKRTF